LRFSVPALANVDLITCLLLASVDCSTPATG